MGEWMMGGRLDDEGRCGHAEAGEWTAAAGA